jgi:Na+-driven multidrug efflux pump
VLAEGASFLRLISFAFVADSVAFTCSAMFRGLGDTRPALASSAVRMAVFVPLAVWLPAQTDFRLEHIWYLSVATVWLQAVVSYLLLRSQFRRRLAAPGMPTRARAQEAA